MLTISCAFSIRKPEIRLSVDLVSGFLLMHNKINPRHQLDFSGRSRPAKNIFGAYDLLQGRYPGREVFPVRVLFNLSGR